MLKRREVVIVYKRNWIRPDNLSKSDKEHRGNLCVQQTLKKLVYKKKIYKTT